MSFIKTSTVLGSFLLTLGITSGQAFAGAKGPAGHLSTDFKVETVRVHPDNSVFRISEDNVLSALFDKYIQCGNKFKGTQEGNKIYIRVEGRGGSGSYKHTLSYQLNDSYELENQDPGRQEQTRSGNGLISIRLPRLKPEIPFVQQGFNLITEDSTGRRTSKSGVFKISRHIQLGKNESEMSCHQTYEPVVASAVMRNQTSTQSQIEIKQAMETTYTKTKNNHFGLYINPVIGIPSGFLFSFFSFNYDYFVETSKQTAETNEFTQEFTLNPGDFYQILRQDTRLVNVYNAILTDPCGEEMELADAYRIQTWKHAFHAVPIDPEKTDGPVLEAVGTRVENTCSEAYHPSTSKDHNVSYRGLN